MAPIAATSTTGQLPVSVGRSAEARFVKRVNAELAAQFGGAPSAVQRLLIDRIAILSLRIRMVDENPDLPDRVEYLDLTRLLAESLDQLGAPPVAPEAAA